MATLTAYGTCGSSLEGETCTRLVGWILILIPKKGDLHCENWR